MPSPLYLFGLACGTILGAASPFLAVCILGWFESWRARRRGENH